MLKSRSISPFFVSNYLDNWAVHIELDPSWLHIISDHYWICPHALLHEVNYRREIQGLDPLHTPISEQPTPLDGELRETGFWAAWGAFLLQGGQAVLSGMKKPKRHWDDILSELLQESPAMA